MKMRKLTWWALLLTAASCNGKLSVTGDGTAGGAGMSASAGRTFEATTAGRAGEAAGGAGDAGSNVGTSGRNAYVAGREEPFGGAGAGPTPERPGSLGEDCIPGGLLTEADGTAAKAVIRTLDRCTEGLTCNAQHKCVEPPDCPDNGLCVMRRAMIGENGAGGTSGTGIEGSGGFDTGDPSSAGGANIKTATNRIGVGALAASASTVYWVEYGTRDALGNYQHDGALMARALDDGTNSVLVSGLDGPVGVELTTSHVYVYIDGAPLIGTLTHPQLFRLPLAGGAPELVQDGAQPRSFAAAGSRAFWISMGEDKIYTMSSEADAVPSVVLEGDARALTCDATDLYYLKNYDVLTRVPISGTGPVDVGLRTAEFALHGADVFGLESIDAGGLLSRAPKSGGTFTRVRALGAGAPSRLRVVGDHYFLDVIPPGAVGTTPGSYRSQTQVLTAGFADTDPPIRLLERKQRVAQINRLWVGTAEDLYWSDGRAIYKQPLPTP